MTASWKACRHFLVFFSSVEDDDELGSLTVIYYNLSKKNKSEKEANKKKVDVHLLATNALVIFWRSVF